jgi:hypothetical protein
MRKGFWIWLAAAYLLMGCQSDSKADKSRSIPENLPTYTNEEGTLISNGIALETRGVKVIRAFLLFDNSTLVPADNRTILGRQVKLRLVIQEGWKELEGKVALGASETIETDRGQAVLHEKDLFATSPIIDAEAAKAITLNATISKLGRKPAYFLVKFRVWDKQGEGEISGSYKLYVD